MAEGFRPRSLAAAAAAHAGAWVGFHATTGLLALLTAIAGAVAGANLTLILCDTSGCPCGSGGNHDDGECRR